MELLNLLLLFSVIIPSVSANFQKPLLSSSSEGIKVSPSISNAISHAPQIFNTINGAMRQWGSSLKHNGMSYFPVTIAENTLFYHGSSSNNPLGKVEWFAFEVEHAENFFVLVPQHHNEGMMRYLGNDDDEDAQNYTGYLSTFRTSRPLKNVIYLDGMSAAKSYLGTLDTQDRVLLQSDKENANRTFKDVARVQELCKTLPHVEAIIRMELGFELITCNVSVGKDLELISITSHPQKWHINDTEHLLWRSEYMRGVTKRYSGIGANKVSVDFSSMISAYFYPLNLTNPIAEKAELPRINVEEREKITKLKEDVVNLFEDSTRRRDTINWQGVVDELISRYSDRLAYMESPRSNGRQMLKETSFLIERFINRTALNLTASEEQCSSNYLLPAINGPTFTTTDKLIYEATMTVSKRICRVLFEMRERLEERQDAGSIAQAKYQMRELMDWLSWSQWKECGRCDWDEICFIPIWPWGTQADYYHPSCRKIDQWWPSLSYWDMVWK